MTIHVHIKYLARAQAWRKKEREKRGGGGSNREKEHDRRYFDERRIASKWKMKMKMGVSKNEVAKSIR